MEQCVQAEAVRVLDMRSGREGAQSLPALLGQLDMTKINQLECGGHDQALDPAPCSVASRTS